MDKVTFILANIILISILLTSLFLPKPKCSSCDDSWVITLNYFIAVKANDQNLFVYENILRVFTTKEWRFSLQIKYTVKPTPTSRKEYTDDHLLWGNILMSINSTKSDSYYKKSWFHVIDINDILLLRQSKLDWEIDWRKYDRIWQVVCRYM